MQLSVTGLGKKFNKQWIFRNLNYEFNSGKTYAITGHNGSGKSTLVQLLTGFIPPTEGKINFYDIAGKEIHESDQYSYLDIATPYMELIEEFTLSEFLDFHFKFKRLRSGFTLDEIVSKMYLEEDRQKLIGNFSSGMKMRLKLGIGFFSESPILFLDEPTSNLDSKGVEWYLNNVHEAIKNRLVIISSNQKHEYDFCDFELHIPDFK